MKKKQILFSSIFPAQDNRQILTVNLKFIIILFLFLLTSVVWGQKKCKLTAVFDESFQDTVYTTRFLRVYGSNTSAYLVFKSYKDSCELIASLYREMSGPFIVPPNSPLIIKLNSDVDIVLYPKDNYTTEKVEFNPLTDGLISLALSDKQINVVYPITLSQLEMLVNIGFKEFRVHFVSEKKLGGAEHDKYGNLFWLKKSVGYNKKKVFADLNCLLEKRR